MANKYKLTDEIREFIIQQKSFNAKLSCRGLIPLINEHFQVNLSKYLINAVIKQNNLSSPKGRKRVKPSTEALIPAVLKPDVETRILEPQIVSQNTGFMENGGFFFLKAADLKLNLTFRLAESFLGQHPSLSTLQLQERIEALIYGPLFKDTKGLSILLGRVVSGENLAQYSQQLALIPPPQKETLLKLGFKHNFNEINELCKECLLRLNAYVLTFFPPEYQFLDFAAMQKRFYSLAAKVEKERGLLSIQLFYPAEFFWANDIIWQEGFSYAAHKINQSKILTKNSGQIWLNPYPEFLQENASNSP